MRTRDDAKQKALFKATVKLVNDIGFASSSVAKIAKEAKVSPATIYVYYQNKEDLLTSIYIQIKQRLGTAIMENFDDTLPIPDILKSVWSKMFEYMIEHSDQIQFTEQFANSPYFALINKAEVEKYFSPVLAVIERGIKQKMIKDVNFEILSIFIVQPIMSLTNSRNCRTVELNRETIETVFSLAWDAIKR